jgi:hypothetical protein
MPGFFNRYLGFTNVLFVEAKVTQSRPSYNLAHFLVRFRAFELEIQEL